jgi:hypothetical protein
VFVVFLVGTVASPSPDLRVCLAWFSGRVSIHCNRRKLICTNSTICVKRLLFIPCLDEGLAFAVSLSFVLDSRSPLDSDSV